jgi:dolichyl-phosphate beta-glucosyltransferase
MDLSIVIPALNEAGKIRADIEAAAAFLSSAGLAGEIIVVDDGSTDETAQIAQGTTIPPSLHLKVLRLEKNQGKGFAVKTGVLASSGDVVLFVDSGNCVPFIQALPIIDRIGAGEVDVALGSRRMEQSVIHCDQPGKRRILSKMFRHIAILFAGLPGWISDSQCGFKLYRGEVARILYLDCVMKGFLFDLEIILRAKHADLRIIEFPVEWTCDLDSRLRPGSAASDVFKELLAVRKIYKEIRQDK